MNIPLKGRFQFNLIWGEGPNDFLSLAFGGKFSHKLDHFGPNLYWNIPFYFRKIYIVGTHTIYSTF